MKLFAIAIIFILVFGLVCEASAINVRDSRPFHFIVRTPKEIDPGKPFKVVIIAYDNHNRIVYDYNKIGYDASISTTGSGIISPNIVPATSFKRGGATVYFTYEGGSEFEIVAAPIEPKPFATEYLICKGDALEISVWEAEGLTKDVIVTPDGMISFPLIGEIKAEGMTLTGLDKEVTEKIQAFVKNPQVSVMVKKIGGRRVVVLGEVARPGVYQLEGQGTVIEAIAMAGGTTKEAIMRSVAIARGDLSSSPDVRLVNLEKVFTHGQIPDEYIVHPEDIIYVPRQFISSATFFINKVLPTISLIFRTPFLINQ